MSEVSDLVTPEELEALTQRAQYEPTSDDVAAADTTQEA